MRIRVTGPRFLYFLGFLLLGAWVFLFSQYRTVPADSSQEISAEDNISPLVYKNQEDEFWYQIYLNNKRIGYRKEHITHFENGVLIKEDVLLRLKAMNTEQDISLSGRYVTDLSYNMKAFRLNLVAGVVRLPVSGVVEGNRLTIRIKTGQGEKIHNILLESPIQADATIYRYLKGRRIPQGEKLSISSFNPITLKNENLDVRLIREEEVVIKGKAYPASLYEASFGEFKSLAWVDNGGRVLREEGGLGLVMERSSKDEALVGMVASDDLVFESAILPKGKRISQAQRITELVIRSNLAGIKEDRRQVRQGKKIRITRESVPVEVFKETLNSEGLEYALGPELYIEVDDPGIRDLAKKIARDERNLVSVARRTMAYVYSKLEKRPVLGPSSAANTLSLMAGDCTEHAVLLTALLRANGIPARVVVGLAMNEGAFYYHAWTEAYLGEWISMDSTLDQMPCDATHIKLLDMDTASLGQDLASLFEQSLARPDIEILAFKYD